MADSVPTLPEHPFFSCDVEEFAVVDTMQTRNASALGALEPVCVFRVGQGNVFQARPRHVVSYDARYVHVSCDDGATVTLDFVDLTARKSASEGEFIYRGGLEEANQGLGFMRAR